MTNGRLSRPRSIQNRVVQASEKQFLRVGGKQTALLGSASSPSDVQQAYPIGSTHRAGDSDNIALRHGDAAQLITVGKDVRLLARQCRLRVVEQRRRCMPRPRLRELGITIGKMPTGAYNAITDVPGVQVGHVTVLRDTPRIARTGVTMVVPREGNVWEDHVFASHFAFNGNGEMTGVSWLEESGILESAIGITNTDDVGVVRDAIIEYAVEKGYVEANYGSGYLPVVAETWDGRLSDIHAFHVKKEHALQALAGAAG